MHCCTAVKHHVLANVEDKKEWEKVICGKIDRLKGRIKGPYRVHNSSEPKRSMFNPFRLQRASDLKDPFCIIGPVKH